MMDFWIAMLTFSMLVPLIFYLLGLIEEYDDE